MFKRFKPLRLSGWVLAWSLLALAACGGKTSSAAGPSAAATPSNTPAVSQCDPAIMTNIVNDAYDRKSVNLNMGDTLLVMNETNDTFTLKTIPDDGLRYMVVDSKEMEHVPFNKPGTFTLTSQEHPGATLAVVVSSTPGSTCGETPVATIDFGTGHAFTPATATITEGQSIMIANMSGQTLDMMSNPDLGAGMGSQMYHPGERQTILFTNDGTYVFTAQQYPNTHLTVVVKNGPQK
jgi:plastocyanin